MRSQGLFDPHRDEGSGLLYSTHEFAYPSPSVSQVHTLNFFFLEMTRIGGFGIEKGPGRILTRDNQRFFRSRVSL